MLKSKSVVWKFRDSSFSCGYFYFSFVFSIMNGPSENPIWIRNRLRRISSRDRAQYAYLFTAIFLWIITICANTSKSAAFRFISAFKQITCPFISNEFNYSMFSTDVKVLVQCTCILAFGMLRKTCRRIVFLLRKTIAEQLMIWKCWTSWKHWAWIWDWSTEQF